MAEQTEQQNTILTTEELLTRNFDLWEKRGRGWQLWDCPVHLEPAFEPFVYHYIPQQPVIDNGRRHTLFSFLAEKVKGWIQGGNRGTRELDERPTDEVFTEAEPELFLDETPIKEIVVSLAPKEKIDFDNAERFLRNLAYCHRPVSFEIIGTSDWVKVILASGEQDLPQLRQQLRAYFPDCALYEHPTLQELWDDNREYMVIDFGLSQEFMRPIKTFKSFEPDPLIGLVGAMESLDEGEIGIVQVLFEPVINSWTESIMNAVTNEQGKCFFSDCPEMTHLAKDKIKNPLFAATVRVAAQSSTANRCWEISRTLAAGLNQLSDPQSNQLMPLSNEGYEEFVHTEDLLCRQSHRTGMLLNSRELASIAHLPSVSVRAEKLKREIKRTKQAPPSVSGHKLKLGKNIHQENSTEVSLSPDQRRRHTYIIGATGTGKSTLLLNMVCQDIQHGEGIAVLDPHGDLIERILSYVPEQRFEDVVLLDPSDSDYPVGLNILSAYSELDKTLLSSDLVSVFRRLSTSWGDQMNSIFANAILAFLESEKGGTLVDLRRFLVESNFRKKFLQTVKDPQVVYYWQKEFPLLRSRAYSPILTRLDTFLRPKTVRNMVMQEEGLNFHDILNGKKIFLAKLSQGLIGVENAYLLGAFLVSKFHQAAMARQAQSEAEREDVYLYVDEFQNFATESMKLILSGTRKYNLGLVLAHQELKQLWSKNSELANSVTSNPGTRICFRLGDFDAKKLQEGFSYFEAKDLQNLGVGEAIARVERSDHDFSLKTALPQDIPLETAQNRRKKLIELSRKKYARPRKEIEQLLGEKAEAPEKQEPALATPGIKAQKSKATQKQAAPKEKTAKKTAAGEFDLFPEEEAFLKFISQHTGKFVTRIYKALKLSGYKGDKLKSSLVEKGLIVQEETRKGKRGRLAKTLTLTDRGASIAKKLASTGKGGDAHQQLQDTIKEQAKVFGWKADVEKRISRSLESVDVELRKDDIRVAVEVSSTTRPEHEVENIRKCLQAGYDYILAVSADNKHLSEIKRQVKKAFNFKERERIRFYSPDKVKEFFHTAGPSIVSEKPIVSGQITKQKEIMNTEEAAAFLGISKNTLYEWAVQKKIPYMKVGRLLKFKREHLQKWLEKRVQEEQRFDTIDE